MARPVRNATSASTSKSPEKKIEKKRRAKKDANAPKRAATAYMIWLGENRSSIAKDGMKPTEVMKAAGVEWRKIEDKSKWEKLAAKDKERYEKEMAAYKSK